MPPSRRTPRLDCGAGRAGKRDWHKLLGYNRHDCLALRHITLKSSRELEARAAYRRTRFCATEAGREACFTVGTRRSRLEALLERHRARTFAFITAWNPGSVRLSAPDNARRAARLLADAAGYEVLPGTGAGEDPSWEPEESLMILDISRRKALALGRKYGQRVIVFGRRGEPPELVSCDWAARLQHRVDLRSG